jgi:hypothetical protein
MPESTPDIAVLTANLRKLCEVAAAGGLDAGWLAQASDDFVSALLELQARRRGDFDPRRRRTLDKARRILRASEAMGYAGMSPSERMGALRERFGLGDSTIHRLIATARESQDLMRLPADTVDL